MSVLIAEPATSTSEQTGRPRPAQNAFLPRALPNSWAATRRTRREILDGLDAMPLVGTGNTRRRKRVVGMKLLLDWLSDQPGATWQERWRASGADQAGRAWRGVPATWLSDRGHGPWRRDCLFEALPLAISADLVRPSVTWLVGGGLARGGLLVRNLAASRDPAAFAALQALCEQDSGVSAPIKTQAVYRSALILAAKGGTLAQVTVGDVAELFSVEDQVLVNPSVGRTAFYRILGDLGIFGAEAPAMLRGLHTSGQHTVEELIDRYGLACRPVRDLLVDYLRERQPALDYTSLVSLV